MRELTDRANIERFMHALGREAKASGRVYLTGGACAVLLGWREKTIDIDLKIVPDEDYLLKTISDLKVKLNMNLELASPDDFIPELPGWDSRSLFIAQNGKLSFYHYDFYAQALAKVKRGHDHDLDDVLRMIDNDLVEPLQLVKQYKLIEPLLFRYPALDRKKFRDSIAKFLRRERKSRR